MSAPTLSPSLQRSRLDPQPWHRALARPAKEFEATPLEITFGRIPEGLRGTFYQNGTGRLQRGGEPVGHWFDGDGAVLRVGITEAGATGTYRYVQTQGYQRESEAGKFLYGNYGMRYPGPIWEYMAKLIKGKSIKNSANTSVLALSDKLLALWEGGHPHQLDLETLETIGKDALGWLTKAQSFSAHPLRDPLSQEIYSIGVDRACNLSIYRCDSHCNLIAQQNIQLKDIPLLHSFVLAGPYLVFLVSPVVVNTLPLLFNQQSYADSMQWKGDRGTRIIVVDRERLEIVSEGRADAWFQWHFGNGCMDTDGNLRLDFVRFNEFTSINEVLREVPTGRMETIACGQLWQLRLDPKTGRVISNERVLSRDCEFPLVPAAQVGQPWQKTYLLMHREGVSTGQDWFGAIGKFDYKTQQLTQADLGAGHYGSEPLPVTDSDDPERGWLMTVVYNAIAERSELWIFEDEALTLQCKLSLPGIVPLGFHGTWQAA